MSNQRFITFEQFCEQDGLDPLDDYSTELYYYYIKEAEELHPDDYLRWYEGLNSVDRDTQKPREIKGQYFAMKTALEIHERSSILTPVQVSYYNFVITEMDRRQLETVVGRAG